MCNQATSLLLVPQQCPVQSGLSLYCGQFLLRPCNPQCDQAISILYITPFSQVYYYYVLFFSCVSPWNRPWHQVEMSERNVIELYLIVDNYYAAIAIIIMQSLIWLTGKMKTPPPPPKKKFMLWKCCVCVVVCFFLLFLIGLEPIPQKACIVYCLFVSSFL